jgi:recombination protein RecA
MAPPLSPLLTGIRPLDQALGGLPRGGLVEMIGFPSAGATTLALKAVAEAQRHGQVAYIDLSHTFDADFAARCGVTLERLILVRPHSLRQAGVILRDLLGLGGLDLVVFDAYTEPPGAIQSSLSRSGQLFSTLARSSSALLFLVSPRKQTAALKSVLAFPHTAVRLVVKKEEWLYRGPDIGGYRALILITKDRQGPAGQQIAVTIRLDDAITIEAT